MMSDMIRFGSFLLAFIMAAPVSQAAVWKVVNSWNETWEDQYSEWIATEVDTDFFVPVRLPVDCADNCYLVRAVFARNHSLPFLASDAWGKTIGHFSKQWDNLPLAKDWRQDKRLRAFLLAVVYHITTKSFPLDTYPVALNADTVKPGLMVYENIIASHACFIGRIDPAQIIPIHFFEASVPANVRFKHSTTLDVFIYNAPVPREHSGIVRWNWPVFRNGKWALVPDAEMPHYSEAIYESDFPYRKQLSKALNRIVKESSAGKTLTEDDYINELTGYFKEEALFRCSIVKQAEAILKKRGKNYRSETFDYTYNTDSRDERLYKLLRQVWAGLDEYNVNREKFFQALRAVPVSISGRLPDTSLFELFIAVDHHWISPDAYVTPEERWGMRWDKEKQEWIFGGSHRLNEIIAWYNPSKEPPKEPEISQEKQEEYGEYNRTPPVQDWQ